MGARKHYSVYVISEDYFCCSVMQFDAHTAFLFDKNTLFVDGIKFTNSDGFRDLEEGWIN